MAIRTKVEEKDSLSMRCGINPMENCQGSKCMAWMEEEV